MVSCLWDYDRHRPAVVRWLRLLTRLRPEDEAERAVLQAHMGSAIDLRNEIDACMAQCGDVGVRAVAPATQHSTTAAAAEEAVLFDRARPPPAAAAGQQSPAQRRRTAPRC